jgi:hypothetical protein
LPPAPSSSSAAMLATRAVRPSRSGARGLTSGSCSRPPSNYLHRRTSPTSSCPVPLCRAAATRLSHHRRCKQGAQVYAGPFISDEHPTGMPTLLFPSCCVKPST